MPTEIKVKVIGTGNAGDPYRVNLPTFQMVGEIDKNGKVTVIVPDDECTDGKLDKAKIRKKYKGQATWDHDKVLDDLEIG